MLTLLDLALFTLLAAGAAVGLALALRKVPVLREMDEAGIKPIACDLCMAFWCTLAVCALGAWADLGLAWAWMPSFAVAYTWLARVNPMPEGEGPGIPDEEEPGR